MKNICLCGCKKEIVLPKSKKYPTYLKDRKYILGHVKGNKGKFKIEPHKRAYHERAKNMIDTSNCIINNKDCMGCIDVTHIDQDHTNNNIKNLKALCRSHHFLLDKNYKKGLRFEKLKTLKLEYIICSNKRRYKKIIWK